MHRLIVLLFLTATAIGCDAGNRTGDQGAGRSVASDRTVAVCDLDVRWPVPDTASVLKITGVEEGPCEVSFQEVVRLQGDIDGVAPALPITELSDGSYVTATFSPGILAAWDANGSLIRTFGEGPGQGPGEFNSLVSLVRIGGDTVAAISGGRIANFFTVENGYEYSVTSGHLPGMVEFGWLPTAGLVGVHRNGGMVKIVGDSVEVIEAVQDTTPLLRLVASGGSSLWTAGYTSYRLDEVLPDGTKRHVIERYGHGFDPSADYPGGSNLFDLVIGDSGLIWVGFSTPDPEAPSEPAPTRFESSEEALGSQAEYRDTHFELVSPTGELVASLWYDDFREAPQPVSGSLWYQIDDDLLRSLILLEPVLAAR